MNRKRWVWAGSLLALVVTIRLWVGAPLRVDTDGMAPGVLPGDVVWVWFATPEVGEVVRVRMDTGDAPQLVRWVAGPGQTVEVSEGVLYVDGLPAEVGQSRRGVTCTGPRVRQALERHRGQDVWVVPGESLSAVTVPSGHGWMMGDHRPEAGDSQRWGPVPFDQIEGTATRVVWPSGRCKKDRWSRFGNRIN